MERPNSDFLFSKDFTVTDEVRNGFDSNGYIILRNLLDKEEITKLKNALEHDEGIMKHSYGRDDGEGGRTKVCLWHQPGDDITGIIGRSEKMAGTFEQLLGGELYHYHSKVIQKEARTGGAHIWHQDYGYWYENGCIFPNMGTTWLAIDKADRTNGCLKILVGSHKVGRIDHVKIGDQVGADLERLAQVEKFCPLLHVECEPGDCLFFHCNILHRSDQNHSDNRRWAFLVSYNRADNNPVYKHHHPFYTPLNKVPNSAIKSCTIQTKLDGKDFFGGPKQDYSLKAVEDRSRLEKAQ